MNKTSNCAAKIGAVIMAIGVMLITVKMPTAVHQPGLQAGIDKSYDVTADATGIPNGGAWVEQTSEDRNTKSRADAWRLTRHRQSALQRKALARHNLSKRTLKKDQMQQAAESRS